MQGIVQYSPYIVEKSFVENILFIIILLYHDYFELTNQIADYKVSTYLPARAITLGQNGCLVQVFIDKMVTPNGDVSAVSLSTN